MAFGEKVNSTVEWIQSKVGSLVFFYLALFASPSCWCFIIFHSIFSFFHNVPCFRSGSTIKHFGNNKQRKNSLASISRWGQRSLRYKLLKTFWYFFIKKGWHLAHRQSHINQQDICYVPKKLSKYKNELIDVDLIRGEDHVIYRATFGLPPFSCWVQGLLCPGSCVLRKAVNCRRRVANLIPFN